MNAPPGATPQAIALDALLEQLLDEEEGESSPTVYPDSRGYATIARGVCVDKRVPGCGLPEDVMQLANERTTAKATATAGRFPRWADHNAVRQAVLVSMCFQMGIGPTQWPEFTAALARLDYTCAAAAGRDTEWHRTQTPTRAEREMKMLESGVWVPHGS